MVVHCEAIAVTSPGLAGENPHLQNLEFRTTTVRIILCYIYLAKIRDKNQQQHIGLIKQIPH